MPIYTYKRNNSNTCSEIEDFAHYLHEWASSAEIRILKVFFKTNWDDNVHLNMLGTARLANHLKFTAHNC